MPSTLPWRRKVLLVEADDADAARVVDVLSRVEGASYDVARARTLEEALSYVRGDDFGVVLLDLNLPDADQLETVESLCAAAATVPIVVLSAERCADVALRAVQAGAQDYLYKDELDGAALAQAMRYAIERKRTEARLVYLAHYDHLTGLANRSLFADRLEQALARAPQNRTRVAVLFLDLDRFKAVNDTWGHDVGDMLLEQVAERLRSCVRGQETVARLGGDEFTVLLDGVRRLDDATTVARRILDAFAKPFDLAGRLAFVTTSIGVAISSDASATIDNMLERADRAMYRAKKGGRNTYDVCTDQPDISTGDLFDTNCEVERALARGELDLVYQPKVQTSDGRVIGMEALLRWQHPRLGLMGPASFISSMEQAGVIGAVGEWVLEQAMLRMKGWLDAGRGDFRVAVNVSPRQLESLDFVTQVEKLLDRTGLLARNLELELTESILIDHSARSHRVLNALRALGVRLAMDDFGTGYASLAYLVDFPIDILKIDRSFVAHLLTSERHRAIVTAITGLGKSLDLEVVAEGVETAEQLEALAELGCQSVQGYLLSQPRSAQSIEAWLDEHCKAE